MKRLRIGTRGSALALWQANFIADRIRESVGVEIEIVRVRTSGDHMQTASVAKPLAEYSAENVAKGIFIKELEDSLLAGSVDLAVHSMKDVPTETPAGLAFPAITQREDPRDCLISRQGRTLKTLPFGARVGTSSLRRQAQLRHHRPDLEVADLRGNVDTRIKKLESGEFDAIVLAMAGVNRLGLAGKITQVLDEETMLPAAGQGALGIETRSGDAEVVGLVALLDHPETRACVTAERAVLHKLQGGCQIPLGALARVRGDILHLEAAVFSPRGSEHVESSEEGPVSDAVGIGERLGASLLEAGAGNILRLAGRTIGHGS
ncbi:MAG: hydroxymethylbilane synthase [Candidatus Acidiferrales bacterium]